MQRPNNLKIGDKFRVRERCFNFHLGEIISLKEDDGSDNPFFWKADKPSYHSIHFSKLEPYAKTIKDAQVEDVVADKGRKKCMSIPHDEMPAQEFIDFVNFNTTDEAKRCRILLAEVLIKLEKLISRKAERNI